MAQASGGKAAAMGELPRSVVTGAWCRSAAPALPPKPGRPGPAAWPHLRPACRCSTAGTRTSTWRCSSGAALQWCVRGKEGTMLMRHGSCLGEEQGQQKGPSAVGAEQACPSPLCRAGVGVCTERAGPAVWRAARGERTDRGAGCGGQVAAHQPSALLPRLPAVRRQARLWPSAKVLCTGGAPSPGRILFVSDLQAIRVQLPMQAACRAYQKRPACRAKKRGHSTIATKVAT